MNSTQISKTVLCCTALVLALWSADVQAAKGKFHETYPVSAPFLLDVKTGSGKIVYVQKFASRRSTAPKSNQGFRRGGSTLVRLATGRQLIAGIFGDGAEQRFIFFDSIPVFFSRQPGQMKFTDHGGQYVGIFQIEIVVRTV